MNSNNIASKAFLLSKRVFVKIALERILDIPIWQVENMKFFSIIEGGEFIFIDNEGLPDDIENISVLFQKLNIKKKKIKVIVLGSSVSSNEINFFRYTGVSAYLDINSEEINTVLPHSLVTNEFLVHNPNSTNSILNEEEASKRLDAFLKLYNRRSLSTSMGLSGDIINQLGTLCNKLKLTHSQCLFFSLRVLFFVLYQSKFNDTRYLKVNILKKELKNLDFLKKSSKQLNESTDVLSFRMNTLNQLLLREIFILLGDFAYKGTRNDVFALGIDCLYELEMTDEDEKISEYIKRTELSKIICYN